jgi:hypothetical protein
VWYSLQNVEQISQTSSKVQTSGGNVDKKYQKGIYSSPTRKKSPTTNKPKVVDDQTKRCNDEEIDSDCMSIFSTSSVWYVVYCTIPFVLSVL